jgi:hypothetical protein
MSWLIFQHYWRFPMGGRIFKARAFYGMGVGNLCDDLGKSGSPNRAERRKMKLNGGVNSSGGDAKKNL